METDLLFSILFLTGSVSTAHCHGSYRNQIIDAFCRFAHLGSKWTPD